MKRATPPTPGVRDCPGLLSVEPGEELLTELHHHHTQATTAGYSVRDAAIILNITPGRISQLTNTHTTA
jgi:hypothetical protein